MNKYKVILSIIILLLLSIQPVLGFEFEKGDGIFRDWDLWFDLYSIPITIWPGHAGMYWQFIEYPPTDPWDQQAGNDILHHAVGVSIPFGVELQKVRFARIDRAINNRQIVENSYVS